MPRKQSSARQANPDAQTKSPKQQAKAQAQASFRASVKQKNPNAEQVNFLPAPDDPDFTQLFRRLQEATPRDPNGFLTHLYDPTQIPPDLETRPPDRRQQLLQLAVTPLSMLEGYLSLPSSKPVWTEIPGEPKAYFEAFRTFLLSPQRSLAMSGNDIDFEVPGFTPYTAREAYTLFYWADRARAYDILKPVAAARLRDQRLLQTEDAHYLLTQSLLKQFGDEITHRGQDSLDPETGEGDERPWQGLKASELVSALMQSMQMQRVSLGLPSHGPKLKNEGFQPAPFTGVERGIREASQNYMGTQETGLTLAQKMRQDIDRTLAEDPSAAATLQAAAMEILLKSRAQQQIEHNTSNPPGYGPPPQPKE